MSKINRKTSSLLILGMALAAGAQSLLPSRAEAAAGDLFASDPTANSIIVYALDGTVRTFATGLNSPQGLAFDRFGNLYVADQGSGNIFKFASDGTRSTFASGLSGPAGLTFDGLVLDVAEQTGNRITRIDQDGTKTTFQSITAPSDVLVAQAPQTSPSSTPDPTLPRTFIVNPTDLITFTSNNTEAVHPLVGGVGVAADGVLNAFVSRTSNDIIQIALNGTQTTFASGLSGPNGMAFRPKRFSDSEEGVGNLFVAETTAGEVSEYTPSGTRSVFATGGHPKYLAFELILSGKLENISTRALTKTGGEVLISGFIITGTDNKSVLLRGLGPSLTKSGVTGELQDPVLELHKPDGTVVTNDNWKNNKVANRKTIASGGFNLVDGKPISDSESIIVASDLPPGEYTAFIRGKNGGTGVALTEVYDLDPSSTGELGNISTRGFAGTGQDVMIGGFIIDPSKSSRILIRGLGPSLSNKGVPNPLFNPFLELFDGDGNSIATNDDWQDTAEGEIEATGIPPSNPRESAILTNLQGGHYTAILRGAAGGSGVGLVEVYHVP